MFFISKLVIVISIHLQCVTYSSQIEDCCCDTETIDANNNEFLNEILTYLRKRTFFRIFKVDIFNPCQLWVDNTMCFKPTCAVQECCEDEVPQKWREIESTSSDRIDRFIPDMFDTWVDNDEDQWVTYNPNTEHNMIYVDLQSNPDGYTGYKGEEAARVWKAIYEAINSLYSSHSKRINKTIYEREERVMYRLISGFHTLTTAMVFANWPSKNDSEVYGPNLELYEKVLHGHPDWIGNLYFDFVFILRALNKVSSVLRVFDYTTGNPSDDAMTMGLVNYLLGTSFIKEQCSHQNSFDESLMFNYNHDHKELLMSSFRTVFRNISDIIDCVGCEKCKLHAKLEVLGLGTALKILFTKDVLSSEFLNRNEILALIVTLGKYSDAIKFIQEMEYQIQQRQLQTEQMEQWLRMEQSLMNKFDELMTESFSDLFGVDKRDDVYFCDRWRLFCAEIKEYRGTRTTGQTQASQMDKLLFNALTICAMQKEHCR